MSRIERKSSSFLKQVISNVDSGNREIASERVAMAVRIADALEAKGMSKSHFAALVGKHPSEITKWLSGRHNFTFDTLCLIQSKLGVKILITKEPDNEEEYKEQSAVALVIQPAHLNNDAWRPQNDYNFSVTLIGAMNTSSKKSKT